MYVGRDIDYPILLHNNNNTIAAMSTISYKLNKDDNTIRLSSRLQWIVISDHPDLLINQWNHSPTYGDCILPRASQSESLPPVKAIKVEPSGLAILIRNEWKNR